MIPADLPLNGLIISARWCAVKKYIGHQGDPLTCLSSVAKYAEWNMSFSAPNRPISLWARSYDAIKPLISIVRYQSPPQSSNSRPESRHVGMHPRRSRNVAINFHLRRFLFIFWWKQRWNLSGTPLTQYLRNRYDCASLSETISRTWNADLLVRFCSFWGLGIFSFQRCSFERLVTVSSEHLNKS